MTDWTTPITLTGKHVRLEPMSEAHVPQLTQIGAGQDFWRFMVYGDINNEADLRKWALEILSRAEKGTDLPFAVIHLASGRVAGATRYMNMMPKDRGLEIGGTWYRKQVQRTSINTECKLMLLTHAFENLNCIAVEFRTHFFNQQSRRAIERLGAKLDGILRNHRRSGDGTLRDTCVYSIIASEWPTVRSHLRHQLATRGAKSL